MFVCNDYCPFQIANNKNARFLFLFFGWLVFYMLLLSSAVVLFFLNKLKKTTVTLTDCQTVLTQDRVIWVFTDCNSIFCEAAGPQRQVALQCLIIVFILTNCADLGSSRSRFEKLEFKESKRLKDSISPCSTCKLFSMSLSFVSSDTTDNLIEHCL